jgi:hypothetical protein
MQPTSLLLMKKSGGKFPLHSWIVSRMTSRDTTKEERQTRLLHMVLTVNSGAEGEEKLTTSAC